MTRLRRSQPGRAGWTRKRCGRGFLYRNQQGQILEGEDRDRCRSLGIPPAWTDVWICPWPNGHIQAVGTDDAGRRQYLYNADWRDRRDRAKFQRMAGFGRALADARAIVAEHLALPGMPRERALAVAFRLLEVAGLRVGGEQYARQRGSVGLATLRREHVVTDGSEIRIRFPGKSGRTHDVVVADPELADVLGVLPSTLGAPPR